MHTSRPALLTLLLASALRPEAPRAAVQAPAAQLPMAHFPMTLPIASELLPAGKTQGAFFLTGLVRKDRTVVLRWANDHGEMPTEGVIVYRQKVGDSSWTALNAKAPAGFLRGPQAEARLRKMDPGMRESLLALAYGNVQHDPATRKRIVLAPEGSVKTARDLSASKALEQFRLLRSAGKIARSDMQLLHVKADLDPDAADAFGLSYTDKPGSGKWRYKIAVKLPEGGVLEAVSAKVFDRDEPTAVPGARNLAAKSGNGAVLLNWDPAETDVAAGYNVYRAETAAGPWKRVNGTPVKLIKLQTEDPELSLRRSMARDEYLERELRKAPPATLTGARVAELRSQAFEAAAGGALPPLNAAQSASIKAGVAQGRLRAAGLQAPDAAFTDSIATAGNGLVNERTYQYRVTVVDIAGGETALDQAPLVSGMPRDLEPPRVPGRPRLKAEVAALAKLRTAQEARLGDARLGELNRSIQSRLPQPSRPLTPFLGVAEAPKAAVPPDAAALPLGEAKKLRLSRLVSTMPAREMAGVAEASVLRSRPDGSAPPAALVWDPSPEADLATYDVFRASGKGAFAKVATTSEAAWTDTGLEVGQAYRYTVSAVDKLGNASAPSPEITVEVCDSALKGRLAVHHGKGKAGTTAPAPAPGRAFLRPEGLVLKSATPAHMLSLASPVRIAAATAGRTDAFRPAAAAKPLARTRAGLAPRGLGSPMAADGPTAKVDLAALQTLTLLPVRHRVVRSLNPMLLGPVKPREIYVTLEWDRPLEGYPMEYVIYQAPQKTEFVSEPRPSVRITPAFRALQAGTPRVSVSTLPPSGSMALPAGGAMLRTTPELHAEVATGRVMAPRISEARKDHRAMLVARTGPGAFTRINEAPVTKERYVVTFPAEAAQYGGATFYYRIQANTVEFGRTVEGDPGEVIEVRLPDVVAPPPPAPGAIDLREDAQGRLDACLTWSPSRAPDLAGYVVDRQAMHFDLVDGEAVPTTPDGEPQRLTPSPIPATAFEEPSAPGGYNRYTLRAVDAAGNVSDVAGHMDLLVPGEPFPQPPSGLALAGATLTWKAGKEAEGYTVWRSFTGNDGDFECISPVLAATQTSFPLPAKAPMHLKVVARSATGMNQAVSEGIAYQPGPE